MPRAGLTAQRVVASAAEMADADGLEAVTLAALAARLGVRPPSLYAHVRGIDELRASIAARGAEQLADELGAAAAGRSGGDALSAVAHAYRAFALAHPGSYMALQVARDDDEEAARAAERVLDVVLAVLRGYGLTGRRALHAARTVRAALHGFVLLEMQGGFGIPLAPGDSFAELVAVLDRGLSPRGVG